MPEGMLLQREREAQSISRISDVTQDGSVTQAFDEIRPQVCMAM
jgi:hypothetical protein